MQRFREFFRVVRYLALVGLSVGIVVILYSQIRPQPATAKYVPVPSQPETVATECVTEQEMVLVKRCQPGKCPGGCPPPESWQQGNAPVAGAIQINPTGSLPDDAVCEATSNNICSQQGYVCAPGKTCKDTWNSVTHQCMCQCR